MNPNDNLTFLGHLEALRFVLFRILAVFGILFVPCWFLSQPIIDWILRFAAPKGFALHYFSLLEPFFVRMKTTVTLDVFLSLPFVLYFIWKFVAPGLWEYERKWMRLPFLAAAFLALFGVAFALFFIVPAVVGFSLSFAGPQMQPVIGIDSFLSIVLISVLACGLLFQFPLVIYGLLVSGVTDVETLGRHRAVVIVGILIVAAIVTPPDVVSQVLLALPTWILYELSLILFRFQRKKTYKTENFPVDDSVYREEEEKGHKT